MAPRTFSRIMAAISSLPTYIWPAGRERQCQNFRTIPSRIVCAALDIHIAISPEGATARCCRACHC